MGLDRCWLLSVLVYHCRLVRVHQEPLGTHILQQLPVAKGTDDYALDSSLTICCRFMRMVRHLVARALQ